MNKICVLGLGYIGLPTAAVLATHGYSVVGVDVKHSIVDTVNNGDIHIEEPGLQTLVQAAYKSGNLRAQSSPEAVDVFIIAVPTPLRGKKADLTAVESAAESIVPMLKKDNLVILESTVPPTTTEELVIPILEHSGLKAGKDFYLAHCPERVLPGNILREIIENDRIIGGINPESAERARELYSGFVSGRIFLTDATTAELAKIMENTYRDVNIALANELANVCEGLKVDVWEAIELANKHPRVNLLRPGPGVGGHCLAVDPWFVVQKAPEAAKLIRLSREINDSQPQFVVSMIEEMIKGIPNPKVTVLGVAYKGNVDDTRESPAIAIIRSLEAVRCQVRIVDPHVKNFEYPTVGTEEAFTNSDCTVLVTDHDEFKTLSPEELGPLMRTKQILDTRRCLNLEKWRAAGFNVRLLGVGG
jgi:UDP-N-acetyl-D-mannosaminuronic acid dehydrogenase